MPTIAEALATAAADLRAAVAAVLGLEIRVNQALATKTTQIETKIVEFERRPAVATIFCDPIDGNDANDGSTIAKAKKSLDAIAAGMTGPQGVTVLLLADAVVRRRTGVSGRLSILGAQRASNAFGYIYYNRTISFLGIAENSPIADPNFVITASAGFFIGGGYFGSDYINYALPDQPANQSYADHISAQNSSVSISNSTLTVASQNAGSLIGSSGGKVTATVSLALGAGAAGHLFKGVAAGANPNSRFEYSTNVTSA